MISNAFPDIIIYTQLAASSVGFFVIDTKLLR